MIIENIIRAKIKANAGKIQEIKRVRIVMLIFDRSKQTISFIECTSANMQSRINTVKFV
jgi:hypothetical protein